jgi:hexosaminidase
MKFSILAFAFCLFFSAFGFAQTGEVNIIPKPQTVRSAAGHFTLDRKTKIIATDDMGRRVAAIFNDLLQKNYGFKLETTNKPQKKNAIVFITALPTTGVIPNPEKYSLQIEPNFVRIAGSERGMFYGLQSLMQLLPVEFKKEVQIPAAEISDQPRFVYRGMHLDVGRHFMPVLFVKKYIDLMSQYKFNNFHWHLTEDQGWRIEIKKYPKLTEIGSKRPESVKGRTLMPYVGDGVPVEGFYTQEEIKDVVAYAKAKYITVIPEIELPGHASAALAAYPQFGCKADYQYKVQTTWGIFKEVYCPTDETFKFLEDVLDEAIALFPDSPYIHIGGDEVLKDHWKESAFVQELKKKENLKDEHEVQSYFVRRIEKYINSKGRKMIGWDEILEGGLAPNATVMSWRGMKGGIEAAKAKHDVIMTPTDFVYFDYGQGDPAYEPLNIGSYLTTEKVYSFDPVPKELSADEAKYIIGGQGNVWTEYMKTPENVEYMAFPRMLALSEVLWSKAADKNFLDFGWRLMKQLPRLDKQQVNYRIPEPIGLRNMVLASDEKVHIDLTPRTDDAKIYYTLDGTTPDERSALFEKPLDIEIKQNQRVDLKTITVLPSGRKSSVYAATILRREFLQPVELAEKRPGVTFGFAMPDENSPIIASGETKSVGLQQFAQKTIPDLLKRPFAVSFDGYLNVPVDAIYEFQAESTWGAIILIDSENLIDVTGTKDRSTRSEVVPLKAGLHKISLRYKNGGGEPFFRVRWAIKGQNWRNIGGGELVH